MIFWLTFARIKANLSRRIVDYCRKNFSFPLPPSFDYRVDFSFLSFFYFRCSKKNWHVILLIKNRNLPGWNEHPRFFCWWKRKSWGVFTFFTPNIFQLNRVFCLFYSTILFFHFFSWPRRCGRSPDHWPQARARAVRRRRCASAVATISMIFIGKSLGRKNGVVTPKIRIGQIVENHNFA